MTFTSSVHFTSVSQSTFQLLFKELFMTWTCKQKSLFVKTIPLAINYCSSDKVIRVTAFLIFGVKKQSIFHLTRNWFPKMKIFCPRPEIVFFSIVINHKRCILIYRIVTSRSTSRLVTYLGLFRLLMRGIFGPYILWPFDKKCIS